MVAHAETDRKLSISSKEFVWSDGGDSPLHRLVAVPMVDLLNQQNVKTVLDLGCGNGSFTSFLQQAGFDMTGMDHSLSGIGFAKEQSPEINFRQFDISTQQLPEDLVGKFDAVISVEVIEHLLLPRMLIQNALLALKPGGMLIITTPFHGYWKNLALALVNGFDKHWHPLRDYGHIKFFSKKTLTQLFEEYGLKEIQFDTVGRIPALACSMIVTGRKL